MTDANGPASNPLDAVTASWSASMEAMAAWSQTMQSLLENRGGPATQMMTGVAGNPATWPKAMTPIFDEVQRALALPRFADIPRLDAALIPAPGAAVEITLLVQQYIAAAMPAWAKACETFQAEIAARRAKGEAIDVADGMDIWNGTLDRTLMAFNRSGEFAELQKRLLRLAMQQRQATRKRAEVVAEALDMPTRTEMIDVYRRLHGLMREVHAVRAEVRTLKAQRAATTQGD